MWPPTPPIGSAEIWKLVTVSRQGQTPGPSPGPWRPRSLHPAAVGSGGSGHADSGDPITRAPTGIAETWRLAGGSRPRSVLREPPRGAARVSFSLVHGQVDLVVGHSHARPASLDHHPQSLTGCWGEDGFKYTRCSKPGGAKTPGPLAPNRGAAKGGKKSHLTTNFNRIFWRRRPCYQQCQRRAQAPRGRRKRLLSLSWTSTRRSSGISPSTGGTPPTG